MRMGWALAQQRGMRGRVRLVGTCPATQMAWLNWPHWALQQRYNCTAAGVSAWGQLQRCESTAAVVLMRDLTMGIVVAMCNELGGR